MKPNRGRFVILVLLPFITTCALVALWLFWPPNNPQDAKLLAAAKAGDTEMIQALLKSGTPVDARQHSSRWEPLMKGRPNVMDDYTPLMYAALYNQKEAANVLLKNGAEVDAHAITGNTALMAAANMGNGEIVTLLLKNGADPRIKNNLGADAARFANKRNTKPKFEAIIKQLNIATKKTAQNN